jgi:hypothetical protein
VHRWSQFRGPAAAWQEGAELLAFLAEVKHLFSADSDAMVADRQLSEWIGGAEQQVDSLDPFKNGLGGSSRKSGPDGASCVPNGF